MCDRLAAPTPQRPRPAPEPPAPAPAPAPAYIRARRRRLRPVAPPPPAAEPEPELPHAEVPLHEGRTTTLDGLAPAMHNESLYKAERSGAG